MRSPTARRSSRSVSMSTVMSVTLPLKFSSRKSKLLNVSESLGKKSLTAKVVLRLPAATTASAVMTMTALKTEIG